MLALVALFALVPSARADERSDAQAHFQAGVSLLQDPEGARYEEAYAEFKHAYELSKSATVLGNLGLCAMKLERDGEAIENYTRYLAEVTDVDPDERAQIVRDLETLRVSAAQVDVGVEPVASGAEVTFIDTHIPVRGANVRNTYRVKSLPARLLLRPGRHVITARVGEGPEATAWDAEIAPAAKLEHTLVIPPKPVPQPPPPPPSVTPAPEGHSLVGPGVLTGVGGALLVVGGALGAVTLSKVAALKDNCPNNICPPDQQSNVDSTKNFVRATDFTLLAGGLVTVAGLAWLTWSLVDDGGAASGSDTAGAHEPVPALRGAALCDARGCAAALTGEF